MILMIIGAIIATLGAYSLFKSAEGAMIVVSALLTAYFYKPEIWWLWQYLGWLFILIVVVALFSAIHKELFGSE